MIPARDTRHAERDTEPACGDVGLIFKAVVTVCVVVVGVLSFVVPVETLFGLG